MVAEAAAADGAQPFEFPVIENLLRLIPADHAGYVEFTGGGYDTGSGNVFFVHDPWVRRTRSLALGRRQSHDAHVAARWTAESVRRTYR